MVNGMNDRHTISKILLSVCITLLALNSQTYSQEVSPLGQTIAVPLDYKNPNLGSKSLYFELGAPFERSKPTVFIIADGQQFYVRAKAVANLQQSLFGNGVNVVGIVGRGASQEFTRAALDSKGQPDWVRAWQIFNSEQWVDDIDTVRRKIVGDRGKVILYGRSGGAFLIHQYLAKYGMHALRAYTQAPLNPFIVNELRLNTDHFWEEIGAQNKDLQSMLLSVLQKRASERETIIKTLQRQNFFVPLEQLPGARADLIRALSKGDSQRYEEAQKEYQVDLTKQSLNPPEGIPIRVRIYEFFYPSGAKQKLGGEAVYPDIENQYNIAKPLVLLADQGKIPAPTFNFATLHRLNAEVFVMAGRWDHTADYRSSIALASYYPRHYLFIANDNHTFDTLNKSGSTDRIVRAFLQYGLSSDETIKALSAAEPFRWKE